MYIPTRRLAALLLLGISALVFFAHVADVPRP